jgi:hypothetical protein
MGVSHLYFTAFDDVTHFLPAFHQAKFAENGEPTGSHREKAKLPVCV